MLLKQHSALDYAELYRAIGYVFNDAEQLLQALTHRSFSAEHNERLEFLGDALLNFIIGETLYQRYPEWREGELSRLRAALVNGETLTEIARECTLGQYLQLGDGELKSGGADRASILADTMEAVIGAIYLEAGLSRCRTTVLAWYETRLRNLPQQLAMKDPKTDLQEYCQQYKLALPTYSVSHIAGQQHEKVFTVCCQLPYLNKTSEGKASSRRRAEQVAARAMLELLK